jgi:hypothetical protein
MVEDAQFKGMQTPFVYTKNYKHTEKKEFSAKFSPVKERKKEEKVLVGPGSYDI